MEKMQAVPRGSVAQLEDRIAWKYSPTGCFTTKTAYSLACGDDPLKKSKEWEWIWKAPTHPRISMFLWMAGHQRIPTMEYLNRRGLNVDQTCPRCRNGVEDTSHALRDCTMAMRVWRRIGIPPSKKALFSLPTYEWLRVNSCAYETVHMNIN